MHTTIPLYVSRFSVTDTRDHQLPAIVRFAHAHRARRPPDGGRGGRGQSFPDRRLVVPRPSAKAVVVGPQHVFRPSPQQLAEPVVRIRQAARHAVLLPPEVRRSAPDLDPLPGECVSPGKPLGAAATTDPRSTFFFLQPVWKKWECYDGRVVWLGWRWLAKRLILKVFWGIAIDKIAITRQGT